MNAKASDSILNFAIQVISEALGSFAAITISAVNAASIDVMLNTTVSCTFNQLGVRDTMYISKSSTAVET